MVYWFEKVCFEYGTNGFCNKHVLIVKRLNVVHDSHSLTTSVLIWKGLLRIWNQLFLQQPSSYGETSQCCPWQPEPKIIGTDLKRSAPNLKPTISATTFCSLRNVSVLSMTARAWDHRYRFEEVCFESETSGFCDNHFLIVKRLSVVHGNENHWSSVLIRRGLLQMWNQRFLQQLFSYGEASQCCPWQPKPWMICTDLRRSASNRKPMVSATTIFSLWNVSVMSMTAKA